jgi:hypothetical protein
LEPSGRKGMESIEDSMDSNVEKGNMKIPRKKEKLEQQN